MRVESIPTWDLTDRLRKSLRHAEVEPQEMAIYLEVHRNTVTNWIQGRTKPPAAAVKLWAMRTGVPYQWLAHGIDELPHQDSNLEPSDSRHEPPLSSQDILNFRKSIGHTGVIRPAVRSQRVTPS